MSDASRPRGGGSGRPPEHSSARKPGRKPDWVIEKERARRGEARATVWLFGLHAVRDALLNPRRDRLRLVLTRNAADRLGEEALAAGGLAPEMADARRFPAPLDAGSVHQGAAMEVRPLDWGGLDAVSDPEGAPLLVALDRVSDPHNAGAILRSAEVFGARAVIAPARHSAPETGALAKAASGALERQPYLRVGNLGDALERLRRSGWQVLGLDGTGTEPLEEAAAALREAPTCVVLGAEGPGLRERTRGLCDLTARIGAAAEFASLNVSNAAAVALFALRTTRGGPSPCPPGPGPAE